jgi:hypothetical protein
MLDPRPLSLRVDQPRGQHAPHQQRGLDPESTLLVGLAQQGSRGRRARHPILGRRAREPAAPTRSAPDP